MIQLIVEGKELTDISEKAKEWFLDVILNGEEGPFTCQTFDGETKAIILRMDDDKQMSLF